MGKITVDELKKLHSNETPQHVKDFNEVGGVEKYGGKHFDDPTFDANEVEKPSNTPDFKAVKPATEKQIEFLRTLIKERCPDVDPAYTESVIAEGRARVSKAIDKLLSQPKAENTVKTEQTTRLNQYAGQCENCGDTVDPHEGHLTKSDDGRWEIVHIECPTEGFFPFPFGRYAVDTEEGHLAFYILDHKGLWVRAGDEKHRIPKKALQSIVDKISADPEAASIRFGRELRQCGRCGKSLTDEDSRARGIGPVCATKGWS